jgi:hypothetical protein
MGGDLGREILHDPDHVVLRQIGRGDHLEAGGVEEFRHRLRVVAWIGELRGVLIARIADHQRYPLLGALLCCLSVDVAVGRGGLHLSKRARRMRDSQRGRLREGRAMRKAEQARQQGHAQEQ